MKKSQSPTLLIAALACLAFIPLVAADTPSAESTTSAPSAGSTTSVPSAESTTSSQPTESVASALPRFEPQPMLIEVNAPQTNPPINAQYLVVGQAALEAPIRIQPSAEPLAKSDAQAAFTKPAELFDFLTYMASCYKHLKTVEDVQEFSYIQDPEKFEQMISDPKKRERLLEIYHGLDYMEYVFGWFESPETFCALLRMHTSTDEQPYITPMLFTFRDGQWKVFSGLSVSGEMLSDMTLAVWKGDYEKKLKLKPISDSMRAAHQAQIDSRSVVKVD